MKLPAIAAIAAIAFSTPVLAGCQSVKSEHLDLGAGKMATGMHYAAPKAIMDVELIERANQLTLILSQPYLIGDPEATYSLSASAGLFANQKYLFLVNPQTRLLTYINSVSEGQGLKILENIAKGVGGVGALPSQENTVLGQTERRVFSTVIDPFQSEGCDFATACTLTALTNELHARAREYYGCAGPSRNAALEQCLRLEGNPNYFSITLQPMFAIEKGPRVRAASLASACSRSICYRAPAPYRIGVRVGTVSDVSEIVMMPNESPMMAMQLPAGLFATARSRVELVHGMPAAIAVDKGNELVSITAIPLTIINGFFSAVGEVFKLRINYDSSTVNLLKAETARKQAEDDYDAAQRARLAAVEAQARAEEARRVNAANTAALESQARVATRTATFAEEQARSSASAADSLISSMPNGGVPENSVLNRTSQASADPFSDAAEQGIGDSGAEITTLAQPKRLFDLPLATQSQTQQAPRITVAPQPATQPAAPGGVTPP